MSPKNIMIQDMINSENSININPRNSGRIVFETPKQFVLICARNISKLSSYVTTDGGGGGGGEGRKGTTKYTTRNQMQIFSVIKCIKSSEVFIYYQTLFCRIRPDILTNLGRIWRTFRSNSLLTGCEGHTEKYRTAVFLLPELARAVLKDQGPVFLSMARTNPVNKPFIR